MNNSSPYRIDRRRKKRKPAPLQPFQLLCDIENIRVRPQLLNDITIGHRRFDPLEPPSLYGAWGTPSKLNGEFLRPIRRETIPRAVKVFVILPFDPDVIFIPWNGKLLAAPVAHQLHILVVIFTLVATVMPPRVFFQALLRHFLAAVSAEPPLGFFLGFPLKALKIFAAPVTATNLPAILPGIPLYPRWEHPEIFAAYHTCHIQFII